MFAIIKTGGKQYKVADGSRITVERLAADKGSAVEFDQVLMLGDKIGAPVVAGAKVSGRILDNIKDEKVSVFKKKRRKNYRRMGGHRQPLSIVEITKVG
ncbi:50S ribosomal protein L21 [Alphaproteobacteria bacterium]|nr:50S ribosomal protein L21 [Alphaproteobacteria bacterium]